MKSDSGKRHVRMRTLRGRIRALHQIERISPIAQAEKYAAVLRVLFQDMHSEQLRIKLFRALDVGDPEHKVTQAFYGNHCNEPPSLTLNTAIILLGENPSINFGMGRAGHSR